MIWCSDFETTTDPNDCRVWAWKSIEIHEMQEVQGTSLDSFLEWCSSLPNYDTIYFHNLKFDGEFIVCGILLQNWVLKQEKGKLREKEFRCLIGDMGQWYQIELGFHKKSVIILDSLKIWNFSIRELAKSMGMEISKGEIDYNLHRPIGYEPNALEWDYIDRDVRIACKAIAFFLDDGYTKMTAGANALWSYRMLIGKQWEYWFPLLDIETDEFIRKSYRGGWTYANPKFREREVGQGIVLDVNSLYPSRMYDEILPYGAPLYFKGKANPGKMFPLYVQRVNVNFHLKEGHFPTIQDKHNMRFGSTEYIRSTNGEPLELTLTNVDLEIMKEQYVIDNIEYIDGYQFMGNRDMFKTYIDHWMEVKEEASRNHDKPKRNQAKLFMNSLYGKFAKRPVGQSKFPELKEDGSLHLCLGDQEERGGLYIPVGTFITAYARAYTIRSAQAVADRFLYADTDSLHLLGEEIPSGITVHESHLGSWKHESTFRRGMYIGAKCYAEEIVKNRGEIEEYLQENPERTGLVDIHNSTLLSIVCAGMPETSKNKIRFEDFHVGLRVGNKLVPQHVRGGIVLKETTFEIKARK